MKCLKFSTNLNSLQFCSSIFAKLGKKGKFESCLGEIQFAGGGGGDRLIEVQNATSGYNTVTVHA